MEFVVLKCFQCFMFQVHPCKKAKKWTCKLCGTKQSLMKVFFQGAAAACRKVVQQSNMMAGKKQEMQVSSHQQVLSLQDDNFLNNHEVKENTNTQEINASGKSQYKRSKWEIFKPSCENQSSDEDDANDINHMLQHATSNHHDARDSRKRKFPRGSKVFNSSANKRERITKPCMSKNSDIKSPANKKEPQTVSSLKDCKNKENLFKTNSKWNTFCPEFH